MATLRTLAVNIVANAEPLRKGLADARGQVDSFSLNIASMGGGLLKLTGYAGAAATAIAATTASMREFTEKEDALTTLVAVLNATGHAAGLSSKEINELAESLELTTKFSDDMTVAAAGVLATFKNVKGDQFKEAIKSAQDLSTVFGGDLTSNTKLIGKALNDPANGLKALSKAGVQFTEQQQAQITVMQESGNLLGAQKMILDQLNATMGGAAVAAGQTLSGQWEQLKAAAGGLGETLFSIVAPALIEIVEATKLLIVAVTDNVKAFLQWIGLAGGATSAIQENAAATQQAAQESEELSESSQKLLESLKQSVATFGMSSREVAIWKAQQEGASAATLEQAKALDSQISALELHKKAQEEARKKQEEWAKAQEDAAKQMHQNGKAVFDETRTAAEKFAARMADLRSLVQNGAIDWNTYQRAVAKANAELRDANGANKDDALGPKMFRRGEADTFDRIRELQNRNNPANALQQKLVALGERQDAKLAQIHDELQRTRQADMSINNPPPFELV